MQYTEGEIPGEEGSYLFERILDAEAHGPDFFRLAHAVDPAEGLLFDHGIPLGLDEVRGGCGCEIKSV